MWKASPATLLLSCTDCNGGTRSWAVKPPSTRPSTKTSLKQIMLAKNTTYIYSKRGAVFRPSTKSSHPLFSSVAEQDVPHVVTDANCNIHCSKYIVQKTRAQRARCHTNLTQNSSPTGAQSSVCVPPKNRDVPEHLVVSLAGGYTKLISTNTPTKLSTNWRSTNIEKHKE